MGPTRNNKRQRKNPPYDPELRENWTISRLKEELIKRGIRVPPQARRMALVRLLQNSDHDVSSGHDSMSEDIAAFQDATRENVNNGDRRESALIEIVSKLSSTVQDLQQNVITLTNKVNTLSSASRIETSKPCCKSTSS